MNEAKLNLERGNRRITLGSLLALIKEKNNELIEMTNNFTGNAAVNEEIFGTRKLLADLEYDCNPESKVKGELSQIDNSIKQTVYPVKISGGTEDLKFKNGSLRNVIDQANLIITELNDVKRMFA